MVVHTLAQQSSSVQCQARKRCQMPWNRLELGLGLGLELELETETW